MHDLGGGHKSVNFQPQSYQTGVGYDPTRDAAHLCHGVEDSIGHSYLD
jgi:hypothetical protein